jgi:hypothetical protein
VTVTETTETHALITGEKGFRSDGVHSTFEFPRNLRGRLGITVTVTVIPTVIHRNRQCNPVGIRSVWLQAGAFRVREKDERVNMRLPGDLFAAVKEKARMHGLPYQRFIREAPERAVKADPDSR